MDYTDMSWEYQLFHTRLKRRAYEWLPFWFIRHHFGE